MQWGYSYFFPATVISAHVTSWGKQSLKFRTDVAMSGRFGFDIDISTFTAEELEFAQKAVQNYKRLDNIILQGDLYRLVSPYDEQRAVLMYVNENKERAVLFAYTTNPRFGSQFQPVRLQGLDARRRYDVREINTFGTAAPVEFLNMSGEQLMKEGIFVSNNRPLTSRIFEITVAR
jgi:alpha-galactosidase